MQPATLKEFDDNLDRALTLAIGGPLHDEALAQACLGVKQGGLGARKACDVVLLAFIASRLQARPFVERLAASLAEARLLPDGLLGAYDEELPSASEELAGQLSATRKQRLDELLNRALDDAAQRTAALAAQRGVPRPTLSVVSIREPGESLVVPAGGEDLEWESASS